MKTLLYALAIITLSAIGVSSLQCIICNSVTDEKCGHGSDVDLKKYLKDCDETYKIADTNDTFRRQLPTLPEKETFKLCRKMVTTVDFAVNKNPAQERVKRTCGWDTSEVKYNDMCYYRAGLGGRITVCTCQADKCNGSPIMKDSSILLFGLVVAVFSITKVWASLD